MVKIDTLDERLLKLLQKDARKGSDSIARQLKVSPATVRRRVRKLIQSGVMRIAAVVDPAKMGLPLAAMIALDVEHEKLNKVIEELSQRSEFSFLATTTGRFDIIGIARFATTEELSNFIQKELTEVDGIRDTETFVCLYVSKTILKPV